MGPERSQTAWLVSCAFVRQIYNNAVFSGENLQTVTCCVRKHARSPFVNGTRVVSLCEMHIFLNGRESVAGSVTTISSEKAIPKHGWHHILGTELADRVTSP